MRSWFQTTVGEAPHLDERAVTAELARIAAERRLGGTPETVGAWTASVALLREAARQLGARYADAATWPMLLEYDLPRRRRRIDAIILARNLVVPIEFKVGAERFDRAARWQAEQYALDLRDFHSGCRDLVIVPLVVATHADASLPPQPRTDEAVLEVECVTGPDLGARLADLVDRASDPMAPAPAAADWDAAPYRPTPSIVEAALDLYEHHDVRSMNGRDYGGIVQSPSHYRCAD